MLGRDRPTLFVRQIMCIVVDQQLRGLKDFWMQMILHRNNILAVNDDCVHFSIQWLSLQ